MDWVIGLTTIRGVASHQSCINLDQCTWEYLATISQSDRNLIVIQRSASLWSTHYHSVQLFDSIIDIIDIMGRTSVSWESCYFYNPGKLLYVNFDSECSTVCSSLQVLIISIGSCFPGRCISYNINFELFQDKHLRKIMNGFVTFQEVGWSGVKSVWYCSLVITLHCCSMLVKIMTVKGRALVVKEELGGDSKMRGM